VTSTDALSAIEPIGLAYDQVAGFGPDHPWRRLPDVSSVAPNAVLNESNPSVSGSPWLDSAALADRLVQTQKQIGRPLSESVVASIRDGAPFVIAGQQPGLLMGPAYVLYKAATAIQWAARLSQTLKSPVLPAFWVAAEDHRLEPLLRCTIGSERLTLDAPTDPLTAGAFEMAPHAGAIESFIARCFSSEARQRVHALFQEVASGTLADHFTRGLAHIFSEHGLIMIDPLSLSDLAQPVLQKAQERWGACCDALAHGTTQLNETGLAPPIPKLSLFSIQDGRRISHDDPTKSTPNLSGGVALRPIIQDALIPTIATVAGPTESAYLWQIESLYDAMGVRRSAVVPRISATVVDEATTRLAQEHGLGGEAIFTVRDALADARQTPDPHATSDADEPGPLEGDANPLIQKLESVRDASNQKIIDKAIQSIRHQVQKVTERLRRDQAGTDPKLAAWSKIAETVYPNKRMQERQAGGAVALWAEHGSDWIDRLLHRIDVTQPKHWWMQMSPVQEESK
jgi:uncharacterized protein YllA (UPF0747 family)